jgi:outer membrane receptor for ferrienterochelin and colicin
LYGAGAMSGVVNLVSRRPGPKAERQLLLNRSTHGATDAGLWYSTPLTARWGLTLLASANGQSRTDVDGDNWADLPKYARLTARPRIFWDNHEGRTFFATAGGTWEDHGRFDAGHVSVVSRKSARRSAPTRVGPMPARRSRR